MSTVHTEEANPYLAHHFEDMEQQNQAHTLGLWAFLTTEVMFFGGLFLAYMYYRWYYLQPFKESVGQLNIFFGGLNTVILICSSLTMALGVHAAQKGNKRALILFLILTLVFAFGFLGVKSIEWTEKWHHNLFPVLKFGLHTDSATGAVHQVFTDPNHSKMFYILYFMMTGLHGIHVIIGIGVIGWMLVLAMKGTFNEHYNVPVELTGLYWHFVDLVWIYLFPILYLIDHPHVAHAAGAVAH